MTLQFYKNEPIAVGKLKGLDGTTDAYRGSTPELDGGLWASTEDKAFNKVKHAIDNIVIRDRPQEEE